MARDRLPSDWAEDLAARHAVEREVETAFRACAGIEVVRVSTNSFDRLDFGLMVGGGPLEVELKAKRQPLGLSWRALRPDVHPRDLFVLDELGLRKILDAGRRAFLLVRDVPSQRWVLWSAGDLAVASRVRASRVLRKSDKPVVKGKLLFDLAETGVLSHDLQSVVDSLIDVASRIDELWAGVAPWPRRSVT